MNMQEDKLVVIITLNYNQSKMTLDCIDSIIKSTYNNYKLIVVDNGSNEEEYIYLLKHIDSRVLVKRIDKNCGYVGGVNHGLAAGDILNPDYFMIMNNDTILDTNAITSLVESCERHYNKAIVSGKVYHFDDPLRIQTIGGKMKTHKYLIVDTQGRNEMDKGQYDQEEERDMIDDIFWLIPSSIYKEIGNYSNHFFLYAEQGDYARRALKAGFKLIYTPKAKIWHKGSITTGDGNRSAPHVNYWRFKGSTVYRAKYLKKKHFWIYTSKLLFRIFIKFVILRVLAKKELSKSSIAAFRGVLDGVRWTFNKVEDTGYNPYLKK